MHNLLRPLDLGNGFGNADLFHVRMRIRVIADLMPGFKLFGDQLRITLGVLPDHEKRGFGVIFGKNRQNFFGVDRVRPSSNVMATYFPAERLAAKM